MTMATKKRFLTAAAAVMLAAFSLGLCAQSAQSGLPQVAPGEVGIDEHLGATVPLDLTLKDEDGNPVKLADLVDKPTILTLNFFRCTGICTPLLNGVVDAINQSAAVPGKDYRVITVSFDDRDTPEIALGKRTNYLKQITKPFPPAAWHFLTGDSATTKALCDSVGFKFKRQGDQYVHPGAIVFLSPKGQITRYMYGVTFLPADVQMAVNEAARGEARPTINKWLKFCFSYDPAGRGYVFSTTKAGATLVLVLAAAFLAYLVLKGPRKGEDEPKESA
jgi:protein SCO1